MLPQVIPGVLFWFSDAIIPLILACVFVATPSFFSRWTPELQAGATMTPRAAASEIAFLALIMQLILIVLGTIKYKSGSFKNSIHVSRWFKFFRIFLLLVGNFSICNEFGFFFHNLAEPYPIFCRFTNNQSTF